MAVLSYSELQSLVLDELVSNVSTDVPIATGASSEMDRALNDAYSMIWEMTGGTLTAAAHATLWSTAAASGVKTLSGAIQTVGEFVHLWVSDTSGSTGTTGTTDNELQEVELAEIQWNRTNRSSTVGGVYSRPIMYALTKASTTTSTNVNKFTAEVWPAATATFLYFPGHYIPQFTAIDPSSVTVPDVNDIQSRDIAYLAAINLAPRVGRAHLVPSIAAKVSRSTQLMLDRKLSSMVDARQDK